jgi:hypothetical protein
MFSTAGESSRGSAARLPCGVDYSASVFRVREKTEMRHVVSSILPDLLKGKERSKDRSFPLELVVRIELTTCSLRKPDRAVFTCMHMCPQVAVRKGFRAFRPFHGFTQISAKNRKSGNKNHSCRCVQLGDFFLECRNSI